mmetsp:Transcript_45734/g.85801  ORF Transcript_45734/g.85801 Transcript_45734/m.85801 type:complete len:270 (+) Transcript_45734:970-1779(+)
MRRRLRMRRRMMSRKRRREQAKPKTLRMPLLPREARASVPGQGGDVKSAWQQPTRLGGQRRKASSQIQGQAKGQVQAPSPQARKTLRTRRPWKDQKHQHQECQRLARGHLLVQREQQHRTLHHPHLLKHHPRPRCHLSPPLPHQQLPAANPSAGSASVQQRQRPRQRLQSPAHRQHRRRQQRRQQNQLQIPHHQCSRSRRHPEKRQFHRWISSTRQCCSRSRINGRPLLRPAPLPRRPPRSRWQCLHWCQSSPTSPPQPRRCSKSVRCQ